MNGLNVDHAFFSLLRDEHEQIRRAMIRLAQADATQDDLDHLWQTAELKHHFKEEKILFSSLLPNRLVDGGGPLCMMYLDQYILNSPLDRAKRITGEFPPREQHTRAFFESGSAMRIPINEHCAGKAILAFLLKNWNQLDVEGRNAAIKEYIDLETYHMEKEENCFFYHCATLLTPEQADALQAEWQRASVQA